ncbi:MAG: glycosyltransferase family 4 protein [Acidimicrobiales bacterium]
MIVPPGVDTDRIRPVGAAERHRIRAELGLPTVGPLIISASRLVPRKGMDTLIRASVEVARNHPGVHVGIAGGGRDHRRLERLVSSLGAPVTLLGRLPDAAMPGLYACGDVFAMLCRTQWGGLEQEGFGIVFVEAAAAGVPQVAGRSGGAHEAVAHGTTGLVVDNPDDPSAVATALSSPRRRSPAGRDGGREPGPGGAGVRLRRPRRTASRRARRHGRCMIAPAGFPVVA